MTLSFADIVAVVTGVLGANFVVAILVVRIATNGACVKRHNELIKELYKRW